jgi:HAD superfamily hydrolase (TIGR01509 family)
MYDAVIFDCDGVLVDSEILYIEAEIAVLADHGLTYDLGDYKRRFMGMHHNAFFPALDADAQARLGAPLPEGFRDTLFARYAETYDRMATIAGAAEAVAALGCAIAVASSSDANSLRRKMSRSGLSPLFEPHVYSADLVGRGKPHPDIFLYTAERLGVAPERTLVIEDSVNGVLAGRAAGMTVWGFVGGAHMGEAWRARLEEAGASRVLAAWSEARALWRDWRKANPGPEPALD